MSLKIAIIGATGAVGREMLAELEEFAQVSPQQVLLFASPRSEGQTLGFRGLHLPVKALNVNLIKQQCQFALLSAGSALSREISPELAAAGVTVIDNSSAFRMHGEIPLIVPEVNSHILKNFKSGIIANPNCSTIQMVVALKPLLDAFGLNRVHVSTYQSVSGAGNRGMTELASQVDSVQKFQPAQVKVFPQQIAFNAIPVVGGINVEGHCEEEIKMVLETQKIMELPQLEVLATTVRVPVMVGHSEAVYAELGRKVRLEEVCQVLEKAAGLEFYREEDLGELPTALNTAGRREVFVSRCRLSHGRLESNWVQFWCVADNLRKGAATNAIQILELLLEKRGES